MKQKKWGYALLALVLATGLSQWLPSRAIEEAPHLEYHMIAGRNEGKGREAVYQMKVPARWIRKDALPEDPLTDTTLSLCDYFILEDGQVVRISIHNFPSNKIEERIPPAAQVARWQRQFETLNQTMSSIIPQSFSGYSGLLFMGEGVVKNQKSATEENAVLAWSLQLAQEHYRALSHAPTDKKSSLYKQMRADVTIKASGPISLLYKHQAQIMESARTFELIQEIPSRS